MHVSFSPETNPVDVSNAPQGSSEMTEMNGQEASGDVFSKVCFRLGITEPHRVSQYIIK